MFGRKVGSKEGQEVVNLLSRLFLASKEIDTVVSGIKMQIVRLEIEGYRDAFGPWLRQITPAARHSP